MDKLTDGYGLIEGPVWVPGRGLLFSDVRGGGVYALADDGGVSTVFEHRRGIGGMALHASGEGMIVSGRNISYKPFDGGPTVEIFSLSTEGSSFNDITADAGGRIYAGELRISPFEATNDPQTGSLWLIDNDGGGTAVGHDIMLTNGLAFSPDAQTLFHADSRRGVMQYAVHDDGTLGPKAPFARPDRGSPDGLVVSEDGAVWVALAGGSGVAVFEPDGTLRTTIEIPLPMATSVCFGGPDLRQLYIVCGSEGAPTDRSGAVWVVDTDVAGLPVATADVPIA